MLSNNITTPFVKENEVTVPNGMQQLISRIQSTRKIKKYSNTLPIEKNLIQNTGNSKPVKVQQELYRRDQEDRMNVGCKNATISNGINNADDIQNEKRQMNNACDVDSKIICSLPESPQPSYQQSSEMSDDDIMMNYSLDGYINKTTEERINIFSYPSPALGMNCSTSRTDHNDVPKTEKSILRKRNALNSNLKNQNTLSRPKKMITFNEMIRHQSQSCLVDELYDDNDHEDNERRKIHANSNNSLDINGFNSQMDTCDKTIFKVNGQQTSDDEIDLNTKMLRNLITEVQKMNNTITKARNEIQKFRYVPKNN